LGLSLSYDIVKAHGGELKVETKDGMVRPSNGAGTNVNDSFARGTEFIVQLPF
jgi:signal transduction histidine kinase